ncbi:MAG: alanine racemase [Elusimicrobia bacterium]|nr:alanine racemase [Elusimicrobiota bacterium]
MKILRPTYVEINLENIRHNIEVIKRFIGKNVNILAVIKADGYGHGAVEIARILEKSVVRIFGVATIEEGIELRNAGIKKDILVFGSIYPFEGFSEVIKYNLIPTVSNISGMKALDNCAKRFNGKVRFHLKIDTGMGRIGLTKDDAVLAVKKAEGLKNIRMDGIYTHLACASESKDFTKKQISEFRKTTEHISANYMHTAASASIAKYESSHFNMVRPGLLVYGLLPFNNSDKVIPTKPVLSLKTKITFLKTVVGKTSISYCRTFFTKKQSKIATIPIGYADGFFRYNSNNAEVLVRGKRAPVVGNVCMDMTMIDVTDIKNVSLGDVVVVIGSQGKEKITAEEVANRCGTINYEIVTSISKRVPRIYR